MTSNHGGARPNSGRKRGPKKIKKLYSLRKETVAKIEREKRRSNTAASAVIDRAIAEMDEATQ